MQNTFSIISTFQIKHEYFTQREPGIFQLTIPLNSKKTLNNLNLLIKSFNNGFHLLGGDISLLKDDWNPIHFHFSIQDPLFFNYTDLEDFKPGKSLVYLSNKVVYQLEKLGEMRLSEEEFVGKRSLVTVKQGNIQFNDLSISDIYTLTDESGNVQDVSAGGQFQNVSYEEGLYTLSGKDLTQQFYFFPERIFRSPDLVFTIYPADLYEQYQQNGSIHFLTQFKSRMTKWRYILTDPIYKKFQKLSIIDIKKKTIPFEEKEINLNGMGSFRCFESIESIILQDYNSGYFQLVEKPDSDPNNEKIILKALPRASPEMIIQEGLHQKDLYSHIFI
ncbi:hypothetical protein SAMN00777080_4332 [Aquiflexum balticum DSM 16537]|uniref:Uncharacterized protein n=1 Tax=Aquiflexum balticum DSM 16537 TaxID=758820 RepID=A0A1W2HAB5_9BACT|nr:hypothetical protein [Aquiflexum balticum]SMD45672.1 hypothetical protein SAMN00777080_4332 [Aquiflexum balticum DSM 16537]